MTTPSTLGPPATSTARGAAPSCARSCRSSVEEQQVNNFGSSHAGKSYVAGLKPDEYATTLDKAYGVAACFSDKKAVGVILKKLKEADTGISIVISGLIDEIVTLARDLDLKPHTAFLSLGSTGRRPPCPKIACWR